MIADGVQPCVRGSVAKLAVVENQAAVDEALKFYDDGMKKFSESNCPTVRRPIEYYNMKSLEALNIFHKRSMKNNSDKHIKQLELRARAAPTGKLWINTEIEISGSHKWWDRHSSGKDCLMSVNRDPDANKQKMENPLQLVFNKDGKLQLNPEALRVLQSFEVPMVVVTVVGAAHTGKSYLMNCLAGDKNGFSVDSTVQAHTKGIWMWCQSHPQRPNEVLLLLDTEGLRDPEKETMSSNYKSLEAKIKEKSREEFEAHLKKVMSSIKQNLTSEHYLRPGGFQKLKKDLDKAIKEYKEKTKNEIEGCAVLTHFLEKEKPHLDQVQKMDSRLTEEQKRVSALEEELSRVKHEREKMEERRKAFEECRDKEIMEQIKKRFDDGKMCSVEELKEAMEHMGSEMKKYKVEGRNEDAERARQRYEYLKKKYEEATEWSFMKFIRRLRRLFQSR
ncbi:uncharacterized protein [Hemitrygon akajei]|uniref:uncharacterized protein n=1 Tax=Hemitrygon akajei TaxID=2704970 RepID=UPI003BF9B435